MFPFETIIGTALTNLAGNSTCSNLFFGIGGTNNCGLYTIGIFNYEIVVSSPVPFGSTACCFS